MTDLNLGFSFADLADREGLIGLDRAFLDRLGAEAPDLHARLMTARATPDDVAAKEESEIIVALGPHLEAFAEAHAGLLKADGCLWETDGRNELEQFSLWLGLKGIAYFELYVRGLGTDAHSANAPVLRRFPAADGDGLRQF